MTTTQEGLSTLGVVVDRNHTDGKTGEGKVWNKYGFQINGHWYSSFNADAWAALEKGKCFKVYYSEKENPKGGAPFRNVEWFEEVPMEAATARQAQEAAESATAENGRRRTVEEMRWIEALHIAAATGGIGIMHDIGGGGRVSNTDLLRAAAAGVYALIVAGPPESATGPSESPPEAGNEPDGVYGGSALAPPPQGQADEALAEVEELCVGHHEPPDGYYGSGEPWHYWPKGTQRICRGRFAPPGVAPLQAGA